MSVGCCPAGAPTDASDSKTVALEAAAIVGIIICVVLIAVLLVGYFFQKGEAPQMGS
jgi:hypothetical protein